MRATVNGIDLAYEICGSPDAPPVVLHHPLATTLRSWDALTSTLEPHYRVLRFDARGHGETSAPTGAYDFATLSKDVIALMDHVGMDKARFVGLSMGGMVGQHLGLGYGDRFHCLSLVSTSSAPAAAGAQAWQERIALAEEGGMEATVDGAIARWVTDDTLSNRPDVVELLRGMVTSTPVAGFIGWCHAISQLDITANLPAVTCPTQVIVGSEDPATPPAAAQAIHGAIAGSEYVEIPGVSHMLQLENPPAFHAALLPFLAANGPTPH
ncbi:MAG: alpha/beta fold hydrolase [Pseudomonadota bacterium]